MTTARTLITNALRTINVLGDSQPMTAEDGQNCLTRLNDLLSAWKIEHLYSFTTTEYTGTASSSVVTIGPTGNIVVPFTPPTIESGFVRVGNLDYAFQQVDYAAYSGITLKTVASPWPSVGYYDGQGTLYLYPVPSNAEIHIGVASQMSEFATLDTVYILQPGVRRALSLSLAEEIAPEYSTSVSPGAAKLAQQARRSLKRRNHETPTLDVLKVTDSFNSSSYAFGGGGSGIYDGVSDPG